MNFNKNLYRFVVFVILVFLIFWSLNNIKPVSKTNFLNVKYEKTNFLNVKYEKKDKVDSSFDAYTEDVKQEKAEQESENFTSLEDFIKSTLGLNHGLQLKTENSMFSHLNEKILLHDEWLSKESLADYSIRLKKLKKMQRLAVHISGNYKVPLIKAEKIVYSSFVEANKKNLDPTLVLSLIGVESTFNQFSKSHAGAVGLTQVMPNIHKDKIAKLPDEDIWSVHNNIKVGTDILREYLNITKGNIKLALQRYNGSLHDGSLRYSTKVLNKMNNLSKV